MPASSPGGVKPRKKEGRAESAVATAPRVVVHAPGATSPTTSIQNTLIAIALAFGLAIVLAAPGIVHSSKGMPDGTERNITAAIGNAGTAIAGFTHLDWPWNTLSSAFGRSQLQSNSPLMQAPTPVPSGGKSQPGTGGRPPHATPGAKPGATKAAGRPGGGRPHPAVAPLRVPTARHPLRLLVAGDSQTEFVGPDLVDLASKGGLVNGSVDTHYGTGLVRPDFVDWSVVARQEVAAHHPEAVVVFMGGNDNQNITLPNGQIVDAGTAAWTREYERRAEICMRIWAQNGKARVFWLSIPPARDADWARHTVQMNQALRAAASHVPGARYLDILGPITNHGQYADFVNVGGRPTLVRTEDGFHLTDVGSSIVANEVLTVLRREWRFR